MEMKTQGMVAHHIALLNPDGSVHQQAVYEVGLLAVAMATSTIPRLVK